ncbi:MAG: class I SAM-dependent rRNA methyltransferase [Flavipsychrobacter sp.]
MTKFFLRKKVGDRIANGHPWVFANELGDNTGTYNAGDIVELYSYNGSFVGKGYINPKSAIRIRLLTYNKEEQIDKQFFLNKIEKAQAYRETLSFTDNYRLIHAEGDGLPGLIIDRYGDYFVIQIQTLGIEVWKGAIVDAIKQLFNPKGIYTRNDLGSRKIEGLDTQSAFLTPAFDTLIKIKEHNLSFTVDVAHGERTGYFLDQHFNRSAIQPIVRGKNVLDAFCNTGSFSIHAAHYGAKEVLGLDIEQEAVNMAKKNAQLNNYEQICRFEQANAFDVLREQVNNHKKYDVVILNPPSFASSRQKIDTALNGYKEINRRGMQLIKPGGFLVTSSSSNLISLEDFNHCITNAAKDSKRQVRVVYYNTQSADHPIAWQIPTTQHLHFYILQIN